MGLEYKNAVESNLTLVGGLQSVAAELVSAGLGAGVDAVMKRAAQPMLTRMRANASGGVIGVRSGTILGSISAGTTYRGKRGLTIKLGVLRGTEGAAYAGPVEFGHGGPHGPAAPHPFIRPAYDAGQEEAYSLIKEGLSAMLDKHLQG